MKGKIAILFIYDSVQGGSAPSHRIARILYYSLYSVGRSPHNPPLKCTGINPVRFNKWRIDLLFCPTLYKSIRLFASNILRGVITLRGAPPR